MDPLASPFFFVVDQAASSIWIHAVVGPQAYHRDVDPSIEDQPGGASRRHIGVVLALDKALQCVREFVLGCFSVRDPVVGRLASSFSS